MSIGTYLIIGLVVMIIISIERHVLGKWNFTNLLNADVYETSGNIIGFIIAMSINVITWPVSILIEVHNFIRKSVK